MLVAGCPENPFSDRFGHQIVEGGLFFQCQESGFLVKFRRNSYIETAFKWFFRGDTITFR